jgi:hypothetical protein
MATFADWGAIPTRARWPWRGPRAVVVGIRGPVDPAATPLFCTRLAGVVERVGAATVICDVARLGPPDPAALDAVARVRLTAARLGRATYLLGACPVLQDLLVICGLAELLPCLGP